MCAYPAPSHSHPPNGLRSSSSSSHPIRHPRILYTSSSLPIYVIPAPYIRHPRILYTSSPHPIYVILAPYIRHPRSLYTSSPLPIYVIPAPYIRHPRSLYTSSPRKRGSIPPIQWIPNQVGNDGSGVGNDKGRKRMTAAAPGMTGSGMCPPSQAGNVITHLIHSPDSHGLASRMPKQAPPFRREGIEGIICMDFYDRLSSNPRILESLI